MQEAPTGTFLPTKYRWLNGQALLWHEFLPLETADRLQTQLHDDQNWCQLPIKLFGKTVMQPRLSIFQGEPKLQYRYSGLALDTKPWTPAVRDIRTRLRAYCPQHFNCVLLNRYRDGADSMGWHSDDEAELGTRPVIASVSLGASRRFLLREKSNRNNIIKIDLPHNSLLLMQGDLQENWQHSIAKTRVPVVARINLTFREIL